jgi:hypothetical protein
MKNLPPETSPNCSTKHKREREREKERDQGIVLKKAELSSQHTKGVREMR